MIFMVIGVDNSGKTTVVRKLEKFFEGSTVVKSPGPLTREAQMKWMNHNFRKGRDENVVILDRFPFIEELVYGDIIRGRSNFSFNDDDMVDLFVNHEIIVIHCRPPFEKIMEDNGRTHMMGVKANFPELIMRMDEVVFELINRRLDVFTYNYTDPHAFEHMVMNISEQLTRDLLLETMGELM